MLDPTTPQEFEEWLNKQAQLLQDGVISQQEYDDAVKDAAVQMRGYSAKLRAAQEQLKKSFYDLGGSILKGEEGASVYNKSLNSGANVISTIVSKIPYVGKLISMVVDAGAKYATAVNEQADSLFKNYKELSRNGLATGMEDTFKNLQDMGYTAAEVGNMASLVKENATVLANFGGTAAQGTKLFATAAKEIQYSDVGTQFKMMGMSTDDINKGIAGYAKIQQLSGTLQRQNAEQLAQSAQDYIMKQDKLTKLTGISADQQNSIIDAAMADQRYAATQSELRKNNDARSMAIAARNDELLSRFTSEAGPKTAKAFQDYASGMMNSQDAQNFRRVFGSAASMIDSGITDTDQIMKAARRDADQSSKAMSTQARAGLANNIMSDFSETIKLASNAHNQNMADAKSVAEQQQKDQKEGKDAGVKNMVKITQDQRNQTMTADLLTNKGIVPVTKGMEVLADGLENATDIVGQLAGRTQRVGGGETLTQKVKNFFTGESPAAPASTPTETSQAISSAPAQLQKIISAESGGRNIANQSGEGGKATSSATGLAQMTKSTFEGLAKKAKEGSALYGKTFEDMKVDTKLQVAAAQQLLEENTASLAKSGFAATDANVYLAHFLGPAGAKKVLGVPDTTPVENVVSADSMKANRSVFANARTVGDLKAWADKKMASQQVSGPKEPPKAEKGGIISGPDAGFNATLHGTEAVVPLPGGRSIPVEFNKITGPNSQFQSMIQNNPDIAARATKATSAPLQSKVRTQEQIGLLTIELDKLESLVRIMAKQNDISSMILQRQS